MHSRGNPKPAPPGVRQRPLLGLNPVWWLNALLVASAAALFGSVEQGLPPLHSPHLSWWMLAPGFFIAERCVVHLQFRRSAHSFSLGDIPLVFGLIFAAPSHLLAGVLAGTSLTLLLDRRLPPIKFVFNLAQFALTACLGIFVVHHLAAAPEALGPHLWIATFVATQAS